MPDPYALDRILEGEFVDDVDMGHGFLSTRGSPNARRLTLRVHHNHAKVVEAREALKELPSFPRNYGDLNLFKEATRMEAQAMAWEELDIEEWHRYSDLYKEVRIEADEEEVVLSADRPSWFAPPKGEK